MKKNKKINILFTLIISTFILINSSILPSNAQDIDSPKPIINSNEIFPDRQYSATARPGALNLAFGEGIYWYGIRVVLLDSANKNSNCTFGSNVGTEIVQVIKEVGSLNTFPTQNILWINPANSAGKQICIHVQWRSKATGVGGGYQNTYLATTFKDISVISSASPSPSSTIATEFVEPSGSKPSVSGTPIEGSKFKVSIKAWNMNGNGFEGRSVYLKLCGDSNCNNLINSYPVVETGTLNFDVAKTLTMPKVVGKAGQFVYVVDSVITPYHGSADADYKEDYWTNLSSSMKKIEKVQKSSPSATPSSSQSIDESISVENQDMNSLENDAQVVTAPDTKEGSGIFSSFNFGIIIGLMSILLLILLLVLIYVIKNRK